MLDIIISNEYTKIYKTYYPMKNYDLSQDQFFIYNALIDIPLKKILLSSLNIFFKLNILTFHWLKIDNVLEKDFHINLKKT